MIDIAEAEFQLSKQDTTLGTLISKQKLKLREPRTDYFTSLCSSIIGQQVSVAAAKAILNRFADTTQFQPKTVLELTDEEVKVIGLSRQKTNYLKDLARHFAENPLIYNHLEDQSDEQVIKELTAVKGIGVWTAQMFLMFTLQRPDVFAPADVGLQHGIVKLYGYDDTPSQSKLEEIAEQWKPYRTIASWHLWQSLENEPV